jgi:hypothetical protein
MRRTTSIVGRRVVHHDLAWNPAQLEQRVGRVDRLGSLVQRLRDRKPETTLDVLIPLIANTIDERLDHRVRLRERWLEFLLGAAPRIDEYSLADEPAQPLPLAFAEALRSYTMATEADMPGFKETSKKTWNFHWAGVVLKDGADNVTLENFAVTDTYAKSKGVPQGAFIDRDWNFDMYGTVDKSQTFHKEHLDSNTHGNTATSMVVRTDK